MFATDAVLRSGFQHLKQMDWDPQLSGFEGWGSDVPCPTRWCAGLPSWVPASAQPVFGSTCVLSRDHAVRMSLIFTELYPRFSSNPLRSLSPECLEFLLQEAEVEEEGGNGDRCSEEWERGEGDDELFEDFPNITELLPKYYRDNFTSMYRTVR